MPFPPGGATDISARLLGEKLTADLGPEVVIENRGGAGGGVGAAEAARAAPDGYTLFFPSGSVVTANQHIYAKLNYDPEKDFVPVTNVVSGPQVLVVPASSPYKTVKDLIDARAREPRQAHFRPCRHRLADPSRGGEFPLRRRRSTRWRCRTRAKAPALAGLVGGEISFTVTNVAAALPHISGGRVRALGVTSKDGGAAAARACRRSRKTLPGFENTGWFGIVAPTGTPKEIVQKVYRDTKKALEASDLRARLYVQGLAPVGNSPAELGRGDEGRDRALGASRAGAQDRGQVKVDLRRGRGGGEGALHPGAEGAAARHQAGLRRALARRETDAGAKRMLGTMIRNIAVAEDTDNLLCQDTGIPIYNVWIGRGVEVDGVGAQGRDPARLRARDARVLVSLLDRPSDHAQ